VSDRATAHWRQIIVGNLIAAGVVLFAFSGATFRTPLSELARNFGISFLFASCIGTMLGIVMPRVGRYTWSRFPFPLNWAAIISVMAAFALLGTVLSIGLLEAIGVVRPGQFMRWFVGSVRIAVAVTLTIGIFITGYEMMRARVAQSAVEAQLAALESRVQPHFLFNTLNSIASLIHDDPHGAERMTTQLASLMRASLAGSGALVPLADELAIVRDYLEIERVRLGNRLRYAIDGDAGIEAQVPRLALQTLVENSVKYAVSRRREGGTIAIGLIDGDGHVRIRVDDDGPGFDGQTLPAGHGLALLKARLATLFGPRAALEIDSRPGRTSIVVRVPRRT
jgi:signal transduction histidine kinase